jgi:hypothetical protein
MAASSCGRVILYVVDCSSPVLLIDRGGGSGWGSGSGLGSSLIAVRNWLTVATAAICA